MRTTARSILALLGLSACILAGGAAVGFAAEPGSTPEGCKHEWHYETELKTTCIDTVFQHRTTDGTVETLTLCPVCGKEGASAAWKPGDGQLTEVKGAFANFSGLTVRTGTLRNGMQVLTVGFYYPDTTEKRVCTLCGQTEILSHTDARLMHGQVDASIELPKETVENYDLLLVNEDGSETPLDVSIGEKKAFFKLNMTPGTRLIRLAAKG